MSSYAKHLAFFLSLTFATQLALASPRVHRGATAARNTTAHTPTARAPKSAKPMTKSERASGASAGRSSHSSRVSKTKKGAARVESAPAPAPQAHKLHGQQTMQNTRVLEIQQALIREHYLTGDPSGEWDVTTQAAMRKLQADQGWQTKLTPDSRALKLLGLGPDYSKAINAQGSNFTAPRAAGTTSSEQASGFTAASGVKN